MAARRSTSPTYTDRVTADVRLLAQLHGVGRTVPGRGRYGPARTPRTAPAAPPVTPPAQLTLL